MPDLTKYELTPYAKGLLESIPKTQPVILGFGANTVNLRDYPEDKLNILYHEGSAIVQKVVEVKPPPKQKKAKKPSPKKED